MILAGICLIKDVMGIKVGLGFRGREKAIYLKRYPKPEFVKTPALLDPSILTAFPKGKVYGPEDMDREPEPIKLIEPEDM